ncbi:MAG: hypothetical protein ACRDJK_02970 [Actinomycetota bacterium]
MNWKETLTEFVASALLVGIASTIWRITSRGIHHYTKSLTRRALGRAARLLPPEYRDRYSEEWEREVEEVKKKEGRGTGLSWAIHCLWAAACLRLEYETGDQRAVVVFVGALLAETGTIFAAVGQAIGERLPPGVPARAEALAADLPALIAVAGALVAGFGAVALGWTKLIRVDAWGGAQASRISMLTLGVAGLVLGAGGLFRLLQGNLLTAVAFGAGGLVVGMLTLEGGKRLDGFTMLFAGAAMLFAGAAMLFAGLLTLFLGGSALAGIQQGIWVGGLVEAAVRLFVGLILAPAGLGVLALVWRRVALVARRGHVGRTRTVVLAVSLALALAGLGALGSGWGLFMEGVGAVAGIQQGIWVGALVLQVARLVAWAGAMITGTGALVLGVVALGRGLAFGARSVAY